ncbi:hypothetical protein D9757_010526 [Collybiopsis confluens]|uniref:Glycosyltransferase 61 catalytic domain-containing protein n=1 Tax=Collybiopsis confluens TaxID=2823264 RepID=A0A8H5LT00_9AGAR|nr:hypothetical protein D9757_010526 [Collybiopsis confluens]
MVVFRYLLSKRDIILLLLGATCMHLTSLLFFPSSSETSVVIDHHIPIHDTGSVDLDPLPPPPEYLQLNSDKNRLEDQETTRVESSSGATNQAADDDDDDEYAIQLAPVLPPTSILHHAPGYTIFRNLYMSNGTLYILSPAHEHETLPEISRMISTSIYSYNTQENIEGRKPTPYIMDYITPEIAQERWGGDVEKGARNSVFSVSGSTVLFNDPSQFLRHYYHYVAELWFGAWCFWVGAFSTPIPETIPNPATSSNPNRKNWNAYPTDIQSDHPSTYKLHLYEEDGDFDLGSMLIRTTTNGKKKKGTPSLDRAIFMHATADGWRDSPGFNSYFQRAAFPGMSVEHEEDWRDRVMATRPPANSFTSKGLRRDRAFHFPLVLLVDRSAAFREDMSGSHTQRTAAQAWEYMRNHGRLRGERVGGWWEPVRDAVLRFAGVGDMTEEYREWESMLGGTEDAKVSSSSSSASSSSQKLSLPLPKRPLVTYISRQGGSRRKLTAESHQSLVNAMTELQMKMEAEAEEDEEAGEGHGFDFIVMEAEKLSKDEQLRVIGKTAILIGPHGNGLTHLVFMPPTAMSTVIEIFYPEGFAHDYHWTSRALGMKHYAVWNDTYHTHPNEPMVNYPEGFQEDYIPVHGPTVAKIVEERLRAARL